MKTYGFVHLEYGGTHRLKSLKFLSEMAYRLRGPDDIANLVIVNNQDESPAQTIMISGFSSALVTGGDNSNREFTGWDKGTAVMKGISSVDIWIFSNDTVATNHNWSSRKIKHYAHEQGKMRNYAGPWLFGEINTFQSPQITPFGPLIEWVSSYFFAMSDALLNELSTISPSNELLDGLVRERFSPSEGLYRRIVDPTYAECMTSWLVDNGDQDPSRATKWYKAVPLTPESFSELRMKARCCLSEHGLTYRSRKLGADIRSPYDARSAGEHLKKSLRFYADEFPKSRLFRYWKTKK